MAEKEYAAFNSICANAMLVCYENQYQNAVANVNNSKMLFAVYSMHANNMCQPLAS